MPPMAVAYGGGPPITKVFLPMYTVSESDFVERGASDEVILYASCEFGDVAISGGYSIGGGGTGDPYFWRNEVSVTATGIATILQDPEIDPNVPPDSWFAWASSTANFPDTTNVWILHVTVNCIRNKHLKRH